MTALAWICAALTLAGVAQGLIGAWLARRFVRTGATWEAASAPITVLKPLHGDEPLLAKALASLCEQDYPPGFQIVCGVGDASDTAIPVVRAIQDRYPAADIALVVDATRHGANPKVGNLINMLPAARHDLLVIADSDVHVRPGYLKELAAALARPGVGLATVLYAGLPPAQYRVKAARVGAAQVGMGWVGMGWVGALGATQITHGFLPSALLARALGRRDCLGATMALRRETLERIGGLETLKDHLADDNVLGRRVRAQGMDIALAWSVVATTVPERTLAALWRHELRWARTIRTLEPGGYALSILQYPLAWAILAFCLSGAPPWSPAPWSPAPWSIALLALAWAGRILAARLIDHALAPLLETLAFPCPVWLLPLRDLLSAAEWAVSHAGRQVDWRGLTLRADTPPRLPIPTPSNPVLSTSAPSGAAPSAPDHIKGSPAR